MDYYTNMNQIQNNYNTNYYDANYYNNYTPSSFQSLDPRLKFSNEKYDLKVKDNTVENKNDDELWVETWLSKIGKIDINLDSTVEIKKVDTPKKTGVKNIIKINIAKTSLAKSLSVINKLQETQDYLKANVSTMSSSEWKKHTVEIGTLKDELMSILSHFENADALKQLQTTLIKRRKKRINQKKRKAFAKESFKHEKEEQQRISKEIDLWLENMKDSVERAKMEERMKKDADCVLAEVTKKKSEARKHLSLIAALVKLRTVREKVMQQRKERPSEEDNRAFSKTADKLTKMWENALQVYLKEEQGLKMMLEQNASEDSLAIKMSKEKKIIQEWEHALFGPKSIPSPVYWGLTSAERDLETFIAIRKSWDTFLAQPYDEQGSKIPIGWVLPNSNPNDNWAKFLQK